MSDISNIGSSIRRLRKTKYITLQQLSTLSGLSVGYLSNLERNKNSPTLQNMQKICEALDTSVGDLLAHNAEQRTVIQAQDREVSIDEALCMRMETVDFGTNAATYMYITFAAESTSNGLMWIHDYDEIGTIISGSLTVCINDETYHLNTGDTVLIRAHTSHCVLNTHKEPCVTFWAKQWFPG
ncbi:MAG: helix-turn-helix domain-containing protein [Lachnospiraceae bacterium]